MKPVAGLKIERETSCSIGFGGSCLRWRVRRTILRPTQSMHPGVAAMIKDRKIRVAIVGLGFGAEFIPIYQKHPHAEMYAICRRNRAELDKCGDRFGVKVRFTDYNDLLKDPNVDAVHINSPIPDHAAQSLAALKAGKHVACTVPMATTIEECKQLVEAQRSFGKVYMMMETVVYSREYLFAKELYDKGELGRIQFLRGSHHQDMDGWPNYWPGLPADALPPPLR